MNFNFCFAGRSVAQILALTTSLLGANAACAHSGDFDTRFATGGVRELSIPDLDSTCIQHVAIDQDSRILMSYNTYTGGVIVAMKANGDLDSTFGSSGSILLDNSVCDVKVDSKNRIVALANTSTGFELVRFDAAGNPDDTFGLSGVADIGWASKDIGGAALQIDASDRSNVIVLDELSPGEVIMGAARVDAKGVLDSGFGSAGLALVPTSPPGTEYTLPEAIAIDRSGSIYLVGYTARLDGSLTTSLAKLNSYGSTDVGFAGGAGFVQLDTDLSTSFPCTYGTAIAIDASDRVVVAGQTEVGFDFQMFAARYKGDGSLDSSFDGGVAVFPVDGGDSSQAGGVLIDGRGRVVLTGTATDSAYVTYLAAARLNEDGSPDKSFGTDGTELLHTMAWNGLAAFTHDQSILIVGEAGPGSAVMIDEVIGYDPMVVLPPLSF